MKQGNEGSSAQAQLAFRKAVADDAQVIADLVNSGYRGDASRAGWTTEADLLEGLRTDANEVRAMIAANDEVILLCEQDERVIGTVYLKLDARAVYLGMFVVKPLLQAQGIGKRFLAEAERFVRETWRAKSVHMTVLTVRTELIAYYERRGYRRTGKFEPFSVEEYMSVPRVGDLKFEILEKNLS